MGKEGTILEKKIGTIGWWLEREEERKEKLTRKGRCSVSELDWEEKEDGVWNKKKNAPLREKLVVAHKKGWKEDD